MEVDIRLAALGLESLLREVSGDVSAALLQAGSSVGLRTIYGYYHENIGNDDMPLLMIQESSQRNEWHALPNIEEKRFDFNIYGLITHDDPMMAVNIRRAFAGSLEIAVNRHSLGVVVPGGNVLEFSAPWPPIYNIDYNISAQSNPLIRGFVASFAAFVHPSIPNTNPVAGG